MKLDPKVNKVHMVLLERLEMMVLLDTQDLKDHLVKRVMMQLSMIADDAHLTIHPKAIQVVQVNQEILADLASLVHQVTPVSLVNVFLVFLGILEKMVSLVMMELMVNLVSQVSLEDLEMLFTLESLLVPVSSLT